MPESTDPQPLPGRSAFSRAFFAVAIVLLSVALGAGVVVLVVKTAGGSTATGAQGSESAAPTTSLPPNATPSPVLAAADTKAPQPTAAGLAKVMAAPLSAPALGKVTAVVLDAQAGTVLLNKGGAATMQPGSTLKLYTALAAATVLEPGDRLSTKVYAGAVPGEIVLVGGGDPTLSTTKTSSLYPGAASMASLAAAVKAAGGTAITKVTVDGSYYQGATTAPGWGDGDAPSTYAAPITSVMVDGGRTSRQDKAMRSAQPSIAAGKALAAALAAPNAQVAAGKVTSGAKLLAEVTSAPIEDLIEQAISTSDNTLTECLAREVAIAMKLPPTFAGAADAVTAAVKNVGVDVTGLLMRDGSGLSGDDRASAASIASVLAIAAGGKEPRADVVLSALSVAGYNGTLATRFRGQDAPSGAGVVRAKTGTLTAVDSLAGTVLTKDGRLLVFAFLSNGGAGVEPTRAALDQAAGALTTCGCA